MTFACNQLIHIEFGFTRCHLLLVHLDCSRSLSHTLSRCLLSLCFLATSFGKEIADCISSFMEAKALRLPQGPGADLKGLYCNKLRIRAFPYIIGGPSGARAGTQHHPLHQNRRMKLGATTSSPSAHLGRWCRVMLASIAQIFRGSRRPSHGARCIGISRLRGMAQRACGRRGCCNAGHALPAPSQRPTPQVPRTRKDRQSGRAPAGSWCVLGCRCALAVRRCSCSGNIFTFLT